MKFYLEKEITAKQMSIMKSLQTDINGWMQPSMRQVQDVAKELEMHAPFTKEEIVEKSIDLTKKAIESLEKGVSVCLESI